MYVDAKLINDRIYVSEKDKDNNRKINKHLPPYVFYYQDGNGTHKSIYGDKLKQVRINSKKKFDNELRNKMSQGKAIFESDVNVVFRLLAERYPNDDTPPLNISVIDIEADKDPSRGWTTIDSPYAIINAITIFNKWENQIYTLLVTPPTLTMEEARDLLDRDSVDDDFGQMTEDKGYHLCKNEQELLLIFLELIQDTDIITGWNSRFFDMPYIIQRIRIALGHEKLTYIEKEDGQKNFFRPSKESEEHLMKLSAFPCLPRMEMITKYGKEHKTFKIFGRIELDYLELYQKFTKATRGELHSYTLDNVLNLEIKQRKVPYEGTLDELYRNDFRTFAAYNRQDAAGLSALDDKMKMIQLASTMAHMASVTFDKVLGAVSIIEQAILKKLHASGRICFNRPKVKSKETIPGAAVIQPEKGLYEWICSFDVGSLYPSIIRALNISPEVVMGQFDLPKTEAKIKKHMDEGEELSTAWRHFVGTLEYHDLIDETDEMLTFMIEDSTGSNPARYFQGPGHDPDMDSGGYITASAKEWKETLKEKNWAVSANGTVFDLSQEGIVAQCLTEWYADRVVNKQKVKEYSMAQVDEKDEVKLADLKEKEEYYKMIEQVMKIFLNSTYGAYLNEGFRFFDPRLGRSVTLSGRVVVQHMGKFTGKVIVGKYEQDSRALIYGDTDSSYCRLDWYMRNLGLDLNVDNAVKLADELGEKINSAFPKFMNDNFLVGNKRGSIIQIGREIVARRGLFRDVKKKYALYVVDDEGRRVEKITVKGMEPRRSDTPKFVQDFLMDCITGVLQHNKDYKEIYEFVQDFRLNIFREREPWRRGRPCRVNNLTIKSIMIDSYEEARAEGYIGLEKPKPHFSVAASKNTNDLIQANGETAWDLIRDGDKVEVLDLKKGNPYDMRSVAIKVDEIYVPDWFKELPFDNDAHEQKLLDQKLFNVLGSIMDWNFAPESDYRDEVTEEVDFFAL